MIQPLVPHDDGSVPDSSASAGPQHVGSAPGRNSPVRRPQAAEPSWRKDASRRPLRLQWLRFLLAGTGLLVAVLSLVWISSWLRPPPRTDLVLLGADYAENLLVQQNSAGWHVLEHLAQLPGNPHLRCWGTDLFGLAHPPLRLRTGVAWDRGLEMCSQKHTLLIYIAAHGAVDDQGAYILLDDAQAQNRKSRLRLKTILDRLAKLPAEQHKVLVLDCTALVAQWDLGILANEFARNLEGLNARITAIPNLVVISASSSDQRSWSCRPWQETVFGHFMVAGIKGEVTDTDNDGQIDAWDLYAGVHDATQHWAQANRGAQQTPIILPRGDAGQRRAREIELTPVARHTVESIASLSPSFTPSPELVQAWEAHQRLANQSPNPASYSPVAWRKYRDLLIRYEDLLLAGNRSSAQRIHQRMMQCQLKIENLLHCKLSSAQNSLAMFTATRGSAIDTPSAELANKAPTPDPQQLLETLWNAKTEQRAAKWDKVIGALQQSHGRQDFIRITLRRLILQRVIEDPPANLRTGAELSRLLDDPLQIRPTESHFLVMLERDLPESSWSDQRRNLVSLAIETRLLAERTAWCLRETGYAYAERVVPYVTSIIDEADRQRRLGEDLLLSSTQDYERSAQYLHTAQRQYQEAARRARIVSRAIEVYDTTIADIPYLAQSIAHRRPDVRDMRNTHQNWLTRLETLCRNTHDLGACLTTRPTPNQSDAGNLKTLHAETDRVVAGAKKLERDLQERWQMFVSADSPQAWCDLRDALRVPQKQAALRMRLLGSLAKTEQRLAVETTQSLAHPIIVTTSQQSDNAKWSAQAEGRMALAALGRDHYTALAQPHDPTYDELQHRLQVFSVEQHWWLSVAQAGRAIGIAWCRLPQEINSAVQNADQPDRAKGLRGLAKAEYSSRLLPGSLELPAAPEPADMARRARFQQLLEWQAGRSFKNHWFAEDADARPYYLAAVGKFLDDVTVLVKRWPTAKPVRQELTTRSALGFDIIPQYDMTTERRLDVPIQLKAQNHLHVPAGFPVVWFEAGPSLALGQSDHQRVAYPWNVTSKPTPLTCSIASPELEKAEQKPPRTSTTSDTHLTLHGRFRGQLLSSQIGVRLHLAADIQRVKFAAPSGTGIAVRADKRIQQRFGTGSGSVAIVLDCTGSMGPHEGQPFTPRTKYAEATRALARVLAQLPQGTTLSLWVFGQAEGPEKTVDAPEQTIRQVLEPVRWNPNNPEQLKNLLARIDYPALEPWNESPIVRALLAAKQDLEAARGFKTIVLLTDGVDNRIESDKETNPEGKDVPSLLRQAFHGSDIEVNIVGFKITATDMTKSRQQFRVVESLFPPGKYVTVSESETLAEALDIALRQRMKYWIETNNHHNIASQPARGLEVSTSGTNDQWYPGHLQPGSYWVDVYGAQPIEKAIALQRGDQLLLRLSETVHGLDLRRVLYGQEDFSWKPSTTSGSWRATVLRNQWVGDASLRMLLGLEPNGVYSNSALSVLRPDQAWIELDTKQLNYTNMLLRWHASWGYPIATWDICVPHWPGTDKQQPAHPRVRIWWGWNATNAADAVVMRPKHFQQLEDLHGRTVMVSGQPVQLESVRIEDHYVQVTPDSRQLRTCLVVRLRHAPTQTVWVEPGALSAEGAEHRFYRKIGRYTGLFWPVTDASVAHSLDRLNLISLKTFQQSAEQRGNTIAFESLPTPDPNDVGPRPIIALPQATPNQENPQSTATQSGAALRAVTQHAVPYHTNRSKSKQEDTE